jgi:hypothetical protein
MHRDTSIYVEILKAWQEIVEHITDRDVQDLEAMDDAEVPAALMGLLVAADISPSDAEDLLVRVGLLEEESV